LQATPGRSLPPRDATGNPINETKNRRIIMETTRFNASELCSRKLWQLVTKQEAAEVGDEELQAAIDELATRRHYLEELREIGTLKEPSPGT